MQNPYELPPSKNKRSQMLSNDPKRLQLTSKESLIDSNISFVNADSVKHADSQSRAVSATARSTNKKSKLKGGDPFDNPNQGMILSEQVFS